MKAPAPVIIVDDDNDDADIMQEVWRELKFDYPLVFLHTGEELIEYIHSPEKALPFLIVSEIILPNMNGFQLKEMLMKEELTHIKSIPFIFMSSLASEVEIKQAYSVCAHGFFIKNISFDDLVEEFRSIVSYWSKSKVPQKI
jgi:CheY-like chemotaxis protein